MHVTEYLAQFGLFMIPFLFALCFHEFAHGWVAKQKGDNTAEILGRLTLNPLAHIDFMGTLLIPSLALFFGWPLFGWAKPVPVNPRNLKHVTEDMFWIALAGPLSNILLAVVGSILLHLLVFSGGVTSAMRAFYEPFSQMLQLFILINLFLAIFNLLPVHPLDGGKILARFLPRDINNFLEENQTMTSILLLCLVFLGGLTFIAGPVYWLAGILMPGGF